MKTIVVANQKGGIGKTTTATALSSILSSKGYNTLLIDADMQGNSTDTYKALFEGQATLYDVILDDNRIPIAEAIQITENGKILASDPLLRRADEILNGSVDGLYRLKDALADLQGFDYVIIDTAPSMNSLLYNALIAADEIIIPVTADRYGLQGLSQLSETISVVKKRQNTNLKIAGLLLVRFDERTNLSKEVKKSLNEIVEKIDTKLFNTTIRESIKAKEAQALRKPLIKHASSSTTALDYISFVEELLKEWL
ncbi:MAG: ParA family protein [Sedimentibacter sp.]